MNGLKDLIAVNVAYSSRLRMAKSIAATVHISLLACEHFEEKEEKL